MGGSYYDDSIIDPEARRVLLNDVWSSPDGIEWTEVTAEAPWTARAGAALVVKNGYLWLIGGEQAFSALKPTSMTFGASACQRTDPYFNQKSEYDSLVPERIIN